MRQTQRILNSSMIAVLLTALAASSGATAQVADQSEGRRPVDEQSRRPPRVVAEPGGQRRPIAETDVQIVREVVYATIEQPQGAAIELTMNVAFLKDNSNKPMPAVVLIHGGGYSGGSKEMFNDLLAPLASGGYFTASIDYRLSGAAPYPAAVHDCKAAVRFLRANAEELGINGDRIGVLGHSAGGHLAAFLTVTGNDNTFEGDVGETKSDSAVQCGVNLSGLTDFTIYDRNQPGIRRIFDEWFAGPAESFDDRIREATVLTHVDGDDPPMLIVHGEADRVVGIEHAHRLLASLEEHGVDVEFLSLTGVGHSVALPETARAVAAFLDEHLGGNASESMQSFGTSSRASQGRSRRPIPTEPMRPPGQGAASESKSDDEDDDDEPNEPGEPASQPD